MKKAMLFLIALLASGMASAATFDFAAYADTDGEAGYLTYTHLDNGGNILVNAEGGVLNADGTEGLQTFAYLDAGNAGLGVCSTGLTQDSQCVESDDDNVLPGEVVVLDFDTDVTLTEVAFRDATHGTTFSRDAFFVFGTGELGSIIWEKMELSALVAFDVFIAAGDAIWFWNYDSDEFYISALNAEVPVPAALFLFAPALLGFLGLRRRATTALAA